MDFVVDEPADLLEGTVVELLLLNPEDWLDEDDRAALHRALKDSDEDIAAGRLVDAEVDDVLTAFGILEFNKTAWKQTGTIRDEPTNSDLFFVTLEKSEREYSPSTLYKDYAISPTLFHWESQSTTTQQSKAGQRYIHHRSRGGNILLFVRPRKKQEGRTMPYTFLGAADYVSHKGEQPISFVWKLRRPMPADFFRQAKVASG